MLRGRAAPSEATPPSRCGAIGTEHAAEDHIAVKPRRVTGTQFGLGLIALASAIALLLFVDRLSQPVTTGGVPTGRASCWRNFPAPTSRHCWCP